MNKFRGSLFLYFLIVLIGVSGICITFEGFLNNHWTNVKSSTQEIILNSLHEPILQGNFVESRNRIKSFSKSLFLSCIDIRNDSEVINSCTPSEDDEVVGLSNSGYEYKLFFKRKNFEKSVRPYLVILIGVLLLITGLFLLFLKNNIYESLRRIERIKDTLELNSYDTEDSLSVAIYEKAEKLRYLEFEQVKFKRQSEIVSRLIHDVKSPLTAFRTASDPAIDNNLAKMTLMSSAAERINQIILDLARETMSLNSPVNVEEVISLEEFREIVNNILNEKKQNNPLVIFKFSSYVKGSFLIAVRKSSITRIISNLINNAVEACGPEGEVGISLTSGNSNFQVEIVNNGQNIPVDVLSEYKHSRISKKSGIGIGLHDSYKYLKDCGGDLILENKVKSTHARVALQTM